MGGELKVEYEAKAKLTNREQAVVRASGAKAYDPSPDVQSSSDDEDDRTGPTMNTSAPAQKSGRSSPRMEFMSTKNFPNEFNPGEE